jgi:hypothetical protein
MISVLRLPPIRELGLQRIVVEWVLLPKILLTEPDDVELFDPAVPVNGFMLGDEVLVCASGDRPRDIARIDLRARVEHVRQIFYADPIAHLEAGGRVDRGLGFFRGFTFFRSERRVQPYCLSGVGWSC